MKISEIDSQSGVVITNVIPDTPADRAGLKEGDIIVSADGTKIESPEDLINHIQSLQVDDEVLLDILRDGDYMEISAKLTQHRIRSGGIGYRLVVIKEEAQA